MTSSSRLDGIFTAFVTPFLENGEIDWPAFDALLDRQLAAGVAGLVPVGTTGEAATLSKKEALAVISRTVKRVNGKAYVLAGTGSNSTTKTINATKRAADAGVDGVLLVTPYYNKPSQQGLIAHYEAVADCALVDNVLYSVPARAGMTIDAITAGTLSKSRSNIIAIKEAGGDPARVGGRVNRLVRPRGFVRTLRDRTRDRLEVRGRNLQNGAINTGIAVLRPMCIIHSR